MAYQALYRKWRPRTFDAVVGQQAITNTLKNAIKRGTISHAFLFAGPRGTGKTSCAKIFAKALNCQNLKDGEPCNECENCRAADAGSMSDIIEIDAASNNGVDEIREIRDKAKYAPTQGHYKVYIIDEVHMLSMGAFNALLKTLEEPPEHVVFVLATTELQKVPATIISRTQRYNFKRISKSDLIARMQYILDQEHVKYEQKALEVIAQVADGGMRDSLSILDQLLSYEKDTVKYDDALKITGYADHEKIEKLMLNLFEGDTSSALQLSKEILASGASSKNILDEVIDLTTQGLLWIKTGQGSDQFLTPDFSEKIKDFPSERFYKIVELANNSLNDLRYTNQQQIPLDVFLVKGSANTEQASYPKTQPDDSLVKQVNELTKQVDFLTKQVSNLASSMSGNISKNTGQVFRIDDASQPRQKTISRIKNETTVEPVKQVKRITKSDNRDAINEVLMHATKEDLATIKDIWPDIYTELEVQDKALLEILEPVAASPGKVVIKCKYTLWFERTSSDGHLLAQLTELIERFTKKHYDIVFVPDEDWLSVRSDFIKNHRKELKNNVSKQIQKDDVPSEFETNNKQLATESGNEEVINKAKELFGDLANVKD